MFKTEVAAVYTPAPGAQAPAPALSNSAATSQWSLCPAEDEGRGGAAHLNGLQAPPTQCLSPECSDRPPQSPAPAGRERQPCPAGAAGGEECQQLVPPTEVVDLKAQLQAMETLISSSQETIKVLLGVIQELEKGEAHREGYVRSHGRGGQAGCGQGAGCRFCPWLLASCFLRGPVYVRSWSSIARLLVQCGVCSHWA